MLYESLAIENPSVAFSLFIPGTIEGDFRASAVDSGPVREADPNKRGLKRSYVAKVAIGMVDEGKDVVVRPLYMQLGHLLWWTSGWGKLLAETVAKRKYRWP
jgi:short-subunit dehydrogenase